MAVRLTLATSMAVQLTRVICVRMV